MSKQITIDADTVMKLVGLIGLVEYPPEFAETLDDIKNKVKAALEA